MKKLFLLCAISMMGIVSAQTGFGAKAGLNIANLSGDGVEADAKMGAYVGVYYEYFINDQFSVQPELVYSMQGAEWDESERFEGEEYSYEAKIKLDYINVPILAKYYPTEELFVVAGPQIGFNVSAKAETKETVNGSTVEYDEDIEDMNVDVALAIGLGYSFIENFGAEVRYNFGLTDIVEDGEAKNSVAQIGLFYAF